MCIKKKVTPQALTSITLQFRKRRKSVPLGIEDRLLNRHLTPGYYLPIKSKKQKGKLEMGENHQGQKDPSKQINNVLRRWFEFMAHSHWIKLYHFCSGGGRKFVSGSAISNTCD